MWGIPNRSIVVTTLIRGITTNTWTERQTFMSVQTAMVCNVDIEADVEQMATRLNLDHTSISIAHARGYRSSYFTMLQSSVQPHILSLSGLRTTGNNCILSLAQLAATPNKCILGIDTA